MNFGLSDEHIMMRKAVRDFAEGEIRPVAMELDRSETFSLELTRKMGEMGLFGVVVSPEYGGQGMDYLAYIIAVEEVSRVNGSQGATVAAANSLGIGPLYYYGTEEQKQKYLPRLCSGQNLWGFGLTEPDAGSDAGGSKTSAVLKDGTWTINGSKIFTTKAANEMSLGSTVQAISGKRGDGKKEISCIIVDQNTPGFEARAMHNKMTWRASNTAELYFSDVVVPEENLLGKRGDGFKQMLATLDRGRLAIAAMGLGGAQGALDAAVAYAKERHQFGKPLVAFQNTQFKLAEIATEIEAARALLYKACNLLDQGKRFEKQAAMAKYYCSEVMKRAADFCVQVHGGYGLMEEYPAAMYYRDQRLLEIGEGTTEVQKIVIARHVIG